MSLYGEPKGKLVRRFGINLFTNPKFERLLQKKPNHPGKERGRRSRTRVSEYRRQLEEKQKLMFAYGLTAGQLRRLFQEAHRQTGITGDNLLRMLELRLDSVVFNAGLAVTRAQARQLVGHRHILVNGRTTNIPSYQVKAQDVVSVNAKTGARTIVRRALETAAAPPVHWIKVDRDAMQAVVQVSPSPSELPTLSDVQMVVEFYSR